MVRCSECGYLTLRDKKTGQLVEVDEDFRATGRVPELLAYKGYWNYPICFAMTVNLIPEVEEAAQKQFRDGSSDWGSYVAEVITKERNCISTDKKYGFIPYKQGFTPREHREIVDRELILKSQVAREEAYRKWQARQQWFLAIVAGVFTIIGGVIGAVIALIASGNR